MKRHFWRLSGRPASSFASSVVKALGIIILANALFFALVVAMPGDSDVVLSRIRTAFGTGELGLANSLWFDSRRGYHQSNDCNILQMLSNRDPSRLRKALGPLVYTFDDNWSDLCVVLHALVVKQVDRDTLLANRYARYWHGYRVPAAIALQVMELRDYRRVLTGAVWFAIGVFAIATYRAGPHVRRTGLAISLAAACVWAVQYFAPGLSHGPGDTLLLIGLAGIVAWPQLAVDVGMIVPYAAGFGALVTFFEMMTGQLPIAAAWLMAVVLAVGRDVPGPRGIDARVAAFIAVVAFGLGAGLTVAAKQILALVLTEPDAASSFFANLHFYMGIPESKAGVPGILVPFSRLARYSRMLTYGSRLPGYSLMVAMVLTWLAATIRGWRQRRRGYGQDVLFLVGTALVPVIWVLLLPNHTDIHAAFMVRILVVPISLAPLALFWPAALETDIPSTGASDQWAQ